MMFKDKYMSMFSRPIEAIVIILNTFLQLEGKSSTNSLLFAA